jgi:hypothetical protein
MSHFIFENSCIIIDLISAHTKSVKVTLLCLSLDKNYSSDLTKSCFWKQKFSFHFSTDHYFNNWSPFENYYTRYICDRHESMAIAVNFGDNEEVNQMLYEYDPIIEHALGISAENEDINYGAGSQAYVMFKLNLCSNYKYITIFNTWYYDTVTNGTDAIDNKKIVWHSNNKSCQQEYETTVKICNNLNVEGKFVTIEIGLMYPFFLRKGFDKRRRKCKNDCYEFKFIGLPVPSEEEAEDDC